MSDEARQPWQHQDLPALQEARRREAARRIRDGVIVVPLACGHCQSTSVLDDADGRAFTCLSCGQRTSLETAHTIRRQKIREIIQRGVDLRS
jgi:hypothetical protein